MLSRSALVVAAVTASAALAASAGGAARTAAPAPGCTRIAIGSAVVDFMVRVQEGDFAAARRLWLPKPRPPAPRLFYIFAGGRRLTAQTGAALPRALQAWMSRGPAGIRVFLIDARPRPSEPALSAYTLDWVRRDEGGPVLRGVAKGLWDCERRRLSRFVGGEVPYATEDEAIAAVPQQCGRRGWTIFKRAGQVVRLCKPFPARRTR